MDQLEPQSPPEGQASLAASDIEEAIRVIADQTGANPGALRFVLSSIKKDEADQSLQARIRRQWSRIGNATKRIAVSAIFGLQYAILGQLIQKYGDSSGLLTICQIIVVALAVANVGLSRKTKLGAFAGAAFAFTATLGLALFALILQVRVGIEAASIIPMTILGAAAGWAAAFVGDRLLRLGPYADPHRRRAELLRQLVELQDELTQTEQLVTFLSVDVVGSTRIKSACDPLASEYTFGQYTNFIVDCGKQFGGSLHSTAGDGIILTFEHPKQAFQAARRIQGGMLEFNSFRNRTGTPFEVRCGIHTGVVMTAGKDVSSVAYSHVLDVVSHVQKFAPPSGIAVTDDAAVYMPGGGAGIGEAGGEIQGETVYIWTSHSAPANLVPAFSPPPPPASAG